MEVKNKMEKKIRGILKTNKKVKVQLEDGSFNQSSSIGGIRWNLPEEDVQAHSSVPSRSADNPNRVSQTLHPRQNSLKELRSLQECVKFIHHWKEQVDQVCKMGGSNPEEDDSKKHAGTSDRRVQLSLEESRKLIQEWASELQDLDQLTKDTPWKLDTENQENKKDENTNEESQMRIMEWAKELQTASETCGVQRDELGRLLRLLGLKKKRLVNLMPLLELITWSLLNEDSTIPQLWLLVKQRTWTAGTPRYIPNSVWSWICSAETDVILDSQTNHPWLQLSEDERKVQEAQSEADVPKSSQRFDNWPCVLGWKGYNSGRHYWEVNIARGSFWRVGVTTAESKRHGRFPMTPKAGYWALWRGPHHFYACTKPETQLPDSMVPKRVGIYIDYEEGQISFYNAETKTHIYTFSGTFKAKLYPLFALLDGRTIMTIIPPQNLSVL